MRLLSVNVGGSREIVWKDETSESSILKTPAAGRVAARKTNLDGDRQSDLRNHGGPLKAVYAYPFEHYPFWRSFLGSDLPMGGLGENLTTEGLTEEVCAGDRFRIGSAEFVVTMPREPCYKFAWLRQNEGVVAAMLRSGHSGFYLAVAREGEIGAGDAIEPLSRSPLGVRIADLTPLLTGDAIPKEALERAMELDVLNPYWHAKVARRLGVPPLR